MAIWNKDSAAYLANNKTLFEAFILADKNGNLINSFGVASNIPIAAGSVTGYKAIHKFGRNPNVGNAPETIWMQGGKYQYLAIGAASTLYAYSADAQDSASGTGARTVTIQGLDNNFNEIEETVTVGGAATTLEFLRVYRAFVATAGSLNTNKGNVLISTGAGGTGTVLADIGTIGTGTTFGLGQTQLALYTIPAGKTGYLTTWNVGCAPMNNKATVLLKSRELDGVDVPFRTKDIVDLVGGYHTQNYSIPLRFPEKTDIEVVAAGDSNTIISSSFDIILVDNPS
jgi:hypothetical protein